MSNIEWMSEEWKKQRQQAVARALRRPPPPPDHQRHTRTTIETAWRQFLKLPVATIVRVSCCNCGEETFLGVILKHRYCLDCGKPSEFIDDNGEFWFTPEAPRPALPNAPDYPKQAPHNPPKHYTPPRATQPPPIIPVIEHPPLPGFEEIEK